MSAIAPPARDDTGTPAGEGATAVEQRVRRRGRRAPEWLVTLAVGVLAAAIGVVPQWRGQFFYYVGDAPEQYTPLWHVFGEQLRAGQWPTMDPAGWLGGNYAAEAMTGLWNPVNLLDYLLVSTFDNLVRGRVRVMVQFLGILAIGRVPAGPRIRRRAAVPAVLVAIAVPVSGFTLWYEASGLARRAHGVHLGDPLLVVEPPLCPRRAEPARAVPLRRPDDRPSATPTPRSASWSSRSAIGVELLLQRRWARLASLAVMAGCVAALAAVVFLPLLGADVGHRAPGARRHRQRHVPGARHRRPRREQLAHLHARDDQLGRRAVEHVPSPTSPGSCCRCCRGCAGTGWSAAGPRWPACSWSSATSSGHPRPVEPVDVPLAGPADRIPVPGSRVLFAVLLSAGLAGDHVRRRAVASGAVVAVGGTWPGPCGPATTAARTCWGWRSSGRGSPWPCSRTAGGGCGPWACGGGRHGRRRGAADLGPAAGRPPAGRARQRPARHGHRDDGVRGHRAAAGRAGRHQQRADAAGQILFGNLARTVTGETLTSYSGIGFREFQQELCMDYRGAVCPGPSTGCGSPRPRCRRAAGRRAPGVDPGRPAVARPDVADRTPPPGWRVTDRTPVRTIWVQDQPLDDAGRVSWSSPGVRVRADSSAPQREVVGYDAGTAARVLFARLAWPGYTAAVDGRPVDVVDGPAGLLAVDVPAGRHTLEVTYRSPGLRLGVVAAAAAGACVLVQAVGWSWRRRRAVARSEQEDT